MTLFNRKYRIRFGQSNAPGREINGLRVAFNVERTNDSDANNATIEIWNLSAESVSELQRKDCVITLEAGYADDIGMIFKGNDLFVNLRRELPDVVTEIRATDGGKQLRTTVVSKGFEPGSLVQDVIRSLVDTFKDVTKSNIDISKLNLGSLSQGFVANGPTKKLLDDILKPRGYDWSIQDNEIRIIETSKTSAEGMFVIGSKTGLIGSPTKTKNEDKSGVSFTCLLNANLRPYRLVKLESETISGIYKVEKVTHRGDSWSGDWLTQVECVL